MAGRKNKNTAVSDPSLADSWAKKHAECLEVESNVEYVFEDYESWISENGCTDILIFTVDPFTYTRGECLKMAAHTREHALRWWMKKYKSYPKIVPPLGTFPKSQFAPFLSADHVFRPIPGTFLHDHGWGVPVLGVLAGLPEAAVDDERMILNCESDIIVLEINVSCLPTVYRATRVKCRHGKITHGTLAYHVAVLVYQYVWSYLDSEASAQQLLSAVYMRALRLHKYQPLFWKTSLFTVDLWEMPRRSTSRVNTPSC